MDSATERQPAHIMIEVTTKSSVPQEVEEVVDLIIMLDTVALVHRNQDIAMRGNRVGVRDMYHKWSCELRNNISVAGMGSYKQAAQTMLKCIATQWNITGNVAELYNNATILVKEFGPPPTEERIAKAAVNKPINKWQTFPSTQLDPDPGTDLCMRKARRECLPC